MIYLSLDNTSKMGVLVRCFFVVCGDEVQGHGTSWDSRFLLRLFYFIVFFAF